MLATSSLFYVIIEPCTTETLLNLECCGLSASLQFSLYIEKEGKKYLPNLCKDLKLLLLVFKTLIDEY